MNDTQEDFWQFANAQSDKILRLLAEKGGQYTAGEESAFWNFQRAAAEWDTSVPYEILQFAQKHWTYLVRFAKHGGNPPRAIESAKDIIIYMLLLLFWFDICTKTKVNYTGVGTRSEEIWPIGKDLEDELSKK